MDDARHLLLLCALRVGDAGLNWNVVAREALRMGGTSPMLDAVVVERSKAADETRGALRRAQGDPGAWVAAEDRVNEELEVAAMHDARLVTVFDSDYPWNLRLIPNPPPFLFIRGEYVQDVDTRGVAVVGTRQATEDGLSRAARLADRLAAEQVTVVSGLAEGIDTAAHRAALDAGGRTVAVLGTGVAHQYPESNTGLAAEIVKSGQGALVSQFWPSTSPARYTFPRRNAVTSGISQGTVVIEATKTSGAKMQARLALEQGKRVWLLHSLVTDQPWAEKYVAERGAVEIANTAEVIRDLRDTRTVEQSATRSAQLTLEVM